MTTNAGMNTRLLIIDDDVLVQKAVRRAMEAAGLLSTLADQGTVALKPTGRCVGSMFPGEGHGMIAAAC